MVAPNADFQSLLKKLQDRLLDLSLRNPLLNYRHYKKRSLRVVQAPLTNLVEYLLNNKKIGFNPVPEPSEVEIDKGRFRDQKGAFEKLSADKWAGSLGLPITYDAVLEKLDRWHGRVHTLHYPSELEAKLSSIKNIYHSYFCESGIHTLYLAIGFLEWYESNESAKSLYAPLYLIPVHLERGSFREGTYEYTIQWTGEEPTINLSLRDRLKHDFGFDLLEPKEPSDLEDYFSRLVKSWSKKYPRWRLHLWVTLGLFNFSKLVLYQDLQNLPSNHPIIRQLLLKDSPPEDPPEEYPIDHLKNIHEEIPLIYDADSSQHSAILAALEGKNLVIEGPPGTGKSQTIANLIAAALAKGKTVLFVAEKMAALEVVHRKLDQAGLGDFCLELHSHKAEKRKILETIGRRLEKRGSFRQPVEINAEIKQWEATRDRLRDYFSLLMKPWYKTEKTIHEIFIAAGRYQLQFSPEQLRSFHPQERNGRFWSVDKILEVEKLLESKVFQDTASDLDINEPLSSYPWFGLCNKELDMLETKEIIDLLEAWQENILKIKDLIKSIEDDYNLFCSSSLSRDDLFSVRRTLKLYCEISKFIDLEKLPPLDDLHDFRRELNSRCLCWLNPRWHRMKRKIRRFLKEPLPKKQYLSLIVKCEEFLLCCQRLENCQPNQSMEDPFLQRLLKVPPERLLEQYEQFEKLFREEKKCFDRLNRLAKLDPDQWRLNRPLEQLIEKNQRALEARDQLDLWIDYLQAREALLQNGLQGLVEAFESRRLSASHLVDAFKAGLFDVLASEIIKEHRQIAKSSGRTLESLRQQFREIDKKLLQLQRQKVACLLDQREIPRGKRGSRTSDWTELALIEREIEKKKKHLPLRTLMDRAGRALAALKPCFMMSPMSVAHYLPYGSIEFDLVIMDEASQIRPQEALGAIARGRQVVIVGDPKQLPPTSFFERLESGEDEEDQNVIEEAESILDAAFDVFPKRQLRWHYRSRHESLIAFPNRSFYDDRLIVFPSPYSESEEYGIHYIRVQDGSFVKRQNLREAERIAQEVRKHLLNRPDESLGVVAMNLQQQELIESLLEQMAKEDPLFRERLEEDNKRKEPLFVKNLENVQGDERDIIFISLTYGPPEPGLRVPQRFGPINTELGWRRLNVLLTRARKRMLVFSSMDSKDILVSDKSQRGVRALRDFLIYCETRELPTRAVEGEREPQSDFEIAVIEALEREGFECVPQVGVAGYFIDIAVRDPNRPGHYLMGIECDGATYHSAKWVRDRDRLRQEILEGLGWRIRRIWSTDWFRDPQATLKPILKELHQLRGQGKVIAF